MTDTRPLAINCDGAVLDNPYGPGGWAFVVSRGAEIIHRAHGPLLGKSNNEAEYLAIINALKWLIEHAAEYASAAIYSDSMLAISQVTGEWQCKAWHLEPLRDQCRALAARAGSPIKFEWIPREMNIEADLEASRGVAEALDVDEEEARWLLDAFRRKYRWQKINEKAKKRLFASVSRALTGAELKRLDAKRRARHRHK